MAFYITLKQKVQYIFVLDR